MTIDTTTTRTTTLRLATDADDGFLRALYATTRIDLDVLGWDDEERAAFCEMQWRLQRAGYTTTRPKAVNEVIEVEGVPVGRLLVDTDEDNLTVVDVAVLPEFQGLGIGGGLLADVQRAAADTGRGVRLQVASGNPARHLYERLGFVAIAHNGLHTEMQWRS